MTAILAIAMLLAVSDFTQSVAKANNWKDAKFDFYYNGCGSDNSSKARSKLDNSMSYVKNSSKSGGYLRVTGEAKKGIVSGQWGDVFGYTYCTDTYDLKPGKCKYFKNDAKRKGYKTTYLAMSSPDHKKYSYYGVWSPDNCSGK